MTSGAGQQPALQARVLLLVHAGELELLARLVGAPALDRVAHRARQALPVDLPLDQVVLRARGDGLDAAALVVEARQHEHRHLRPVALEPVQRGQPVRVGQVEVEQDAVDLRRACSRRASASVCARISSTVRAADREQLLDEQRVAVVVLDEQDPDRR